MRNYFILDGQDSRDFGVYISGSGTFSAPQRAYNMIDVPGRNGALVGSEKRLLNLELTYPGFIYSNFKSNVADFRAFLLSLVGYKRLTDSYHPDEYRMVLFEGGFEPEVTAKNDAGSFDIVFNCKPQRFLLTGEQVTTLTANGTITNPTEFNAQPLLRVYGTGILGINSQSVTISSVVSDPYIDIDCEMMDAFYGASNRNEYITLTDYNFPVLVPGTNSIALGTGITKVEITPRWWTV